MSGGRPEFQAPPEIFYNEEEATKYTRNSRIVDIQTSLTRRAIELLLLPNKSCLLLDVGCGSGISGDILADDGHFWIGVDISKPMLHVALQNEALDRGDLILADLGKLLRFKPGSFDGCISISAIQWLCNADKRDHHPYKRLMTFFKWLYAALVSGSRAVFQFYPESPQQIEMITSAAMRCGFGGGLLVDYPNSAKAKKYFLCLWAGFIGSPPQLPRALVESSEMDGITEQATFTNREKSVRVKKGGRMKAKTREWVLKKKTKQRLKGLRVRPDSKYTARKRRDHF
ncbi:methyltransferase [Cardiosporidium cionae]|uniref:Methyltransferase n=1 Tax=Cardiosporidium cionae TaxID=476202 RepID=A0ABQ7JBP4_9APIC|nr:methyltransferase [Cardiosporidium cionae]|eukprot:KAF8821409.1 methyltransferase [Cardiosporidium cionae]